jgi:hypothetical protein
LKNDVQNKVDEDEEMQIEEPKVPADDYNMRLEEISRNKKRKREEEDYGEEQPTKRNRRTFHDGQHWKDIVKGYGTTVGLYLALFASAVSFNVMQKLTAKHVDGMAIKDNSLFK